jgi:hypothetical protein
MTISAKRRQHVQLRGRAIGCVSFKHAASQTKPEELIVLRIEPKCGDTCRAAELRRREQEQSVEL